MNIMDPPNTYKSRPQWNVLNSYAKLATINSQIFFLLECKKADKVPKGLRIKNPLESTYNSRYSRELIDRSSEKLRNHVIDISFNQKNKLKQSIELQKANLSPNELTAVFEREISTHYEASLNKAMADKKKKLSSLNINIGSPSGAHTVVNKSSYDLSNEEISVLSRGLGFCPSTQLDDIQACSDMEEYFRKLRLKDFYLGDYSAPSNTVSSQENEPPSLIKKKKNSKFTPKTGINTTLDTYITSFRDRFKTDILKKMKKTKYNLSAVERKAVNCLKNNKSIVIKEADKGGATVIQDREAYVKEAQRQLHNVDYYRQTNIDPTNKFTKELRDLIKTFPKDDQSKLRGAIPEDPKPGTFYTLPKIHKQGTPEYPIPGRPIVSGIGTLTENISSVVEKILKPIVQKTPSYIQDTTDFLNKIKDIGDLPEGTLIVTMDVVSLYTNIPHRDGIEALKKCLENCDETLDLEVNTIIELTKFILEHNYFVFDENNSFYVQTKGTSMGTKMAPQYANLFMHIIETKLFEKTPHLPLFYVRFIDDCFFLWTHGRETLNKFIDDFNGINESTTLTAEISETSQNFLDTNTRIVDGRLATTVYRKPTDSFTFLHPQSFHPPHTTNSIVYSQALRYNRLCSEPASKEIETKKLTEAFLKCGYKQKQIDDNVKKATDIPRDQLLEYRNKTPSDRVPLVVTFNPQLSRIKKIYKSVQHIIDEDPVTKAIFPSPPIIAYRQPPSLKNILVKSKLAPEPEPGTFQCGKARCLTCPSITNEKPLIGGAQTTFQPTGNFNCGSYGVIYLISCDICPGVKYIGETIQTLRGRMNGHRQFIRESKWDLPVVQHFNSRGHTMENLRVTVLKGPILDLTKRRTEEQRLIRLFNAIDDGLNTDRGFLANYI